MTKLKYSVLFFHLSTFLISTRAYDLPNNCISVLDTYIHLLLKQYPSIELPAVTYDEVIKIANYEILTGINQCKPYGDTKCAILRGKIGTSNESNNGGIPEAIRYREPIRNYSMVRPLESSKEPQGTTNSREYLERSEITGQLEGNQREFDKPKEQNVYVLDQQGTVHPEYMMGQGVTGISGGASKPLGPFYPQAGPYELRRISSGGYGRRAESSSSSSSSSSIKKKVLYRHGSRAYHHHPRGHFIHNYEEMRSLRSEPETTELQKSSHDESSAVV